jgi:hypothetical protein
VDDASKKSCRICCVLNQSQQLKPKSLPLAKPGVHRRKNDILKYREKVQMPK